jgi:hypothetical protein
MENKAASDGAGFGKPHINRLRQTKFQAGSTSSQRLLLLVMPPVIVRQRPHRHEPTRTAFRDCDEKSEARHTGNSCSEIRANFVRHVCSEVTVDRIAFSQLRPSFGRGDV